MLRLSINFIRFEAALQGGDLILKSLHLDSLLDVVVVGFS